MKNYICRYEGAVVIPADTKEKAREKFWNETSKEIAHSSLTLEDIDRYLEEEKPEMKTRIVRVKRTYYDYVEVDALTDDEAIDKVEKSYDIYEDNADYDFSISLHNPM